MVNRNLLRTFDPPEAELRQQLTSAFGDTVEDWLPADGGGLHESQRVTGRVLRVTDGFVWLDMDCKSEGVVEIAEWHDETLGQVVCPQPGDQVEVLLESVEDEAGGVVLSYRKARRQKEWEAVLTKHKEGDV